MEQWTEYIGRWHVALVHFPIGLLITAALVELVATIRGLRAPTVTAVVMVCCGALAAVLASGLGWIRADDVKHPGAEDIVELHRWAGVIASGLAVATAGVGWAALRGKLMFRWPFRLLVFITAVVIVTGAHWGGELIYGDYYFDLPGSDAAAEIAQPEEE